MLDLEFFSRGAKPNGKDITFEWAKIFCTEAETIEDDESDENLFEKADYTIEGIKVFQNAYFDQNCLYAKNLLSVIREIIKENRPEAILISTINTFMKAVHFSEKSEMDPKMIITENRTMVYYAMIGEDKCAVLIAWDKYFGD